jgi:hypothetical protein
MQKQINLVINGKGGVGKSFFATNLVQYLKDQRLEHRAIDSDQENSTLKRYHPEADFINIDKPQEVDRIFAAAEKHSLLVVDCRAASTDLFLDYFAEVKITEVLGDLGARLTLACPVNHEADSVDQVRFLAEGMGERCRYVVVKNQAHSDAFQLYDDSKTRSHLREVLGAREIVMPRLYDWIVTALNAHNVTATGALTHPAFHLLDRQRLKHWQAKLYAQLAAAADLLLPQGVTLPSAAAAQPAGTT